MAVTHCGRFIFCFSYSCLSSRALKILPKDADKLDKWGVVPAYCYVYFLEAIYNVRSTRQGNCHLF